MRRTQLEEGSPPTWVERAPVIGRGVPPAADRHPDPTAYEMSDVVAAQPFGPCLPPRDQPIGTRTQACEGCSKLELLHPTTVGARRRPHPTARRCLWRTAPGTPLVGGMRLVSLCNRPLTADTPSRHPACPASAVGYTPPDPDRRTGGRAGGEGGVSGGCGRWR